MTRQQYLIRALANECDTLEYIADDMNHKSLNSLVIDRAIAERFLIKFLHVFITIQMLDEPFDELTRNIAGDPDKIEAEYRAALEAAMVQEGVK